MICIAAVGGRLAAGLLVVGLAAACLAGCGSGDSAADGPTATLGTAPPVTDPYALPEVIDAAYVNRVLAALDQAVGDVVRIVVSTRTLSPEAIERLQAWYLGDALQLKFGNFQRDIFNDFTMYRQNPGNKKTVVTSLITARPNCIFAEVSRDFSAVGANPDPNLSRQWTALVPANRNKDVGYYNPTPWMLTYDGFREDLSQPPDPCAAS